jgi:nicotinate-nucleotide adenylyltransferase
VSRVGILGGTFNPPHVAHLVCAQDARHQLALDRVLLMPVSAPPHKAAPGDPGPAVRLELCRLAAAAEECLEVSTLEIDRGGPSYTVDTLREIHAREPGDDLTFIVGADMAYGLPGWREPEAVLQLATIAIAGRSGSDRQDILERLEPLGAAERVVFFDMPRLDVSSSDIRRRVAAGAPIRHLVPEAVAERIAADGLYRVPAGRGVA